MNRKRDKILTIIILSVITLSTIGVYKYLNQGTRVIIKNNTGEIISNMCITYDGLKEPIKINNLKIGEKTKIYINPYEGFSEGQLSLYYNDKRGNRHTCIIIGYFQRGYPIVKRVYINYIDDIGLMDINVK